MQSRRPKIRGFSRYATPARRRLSRQPGKFWDGRRYFRAAGINNGLTANELGISYLLPRQIGFSRAFDILLSGRDVDAEEAERIGLVSQMVPGDQLLDRCYELAAGIIGFSHIGVELTKQLLWASLDAGSLHAHMNHEGNAQLYVRMTTSNFDEKISAWKEGRTPVYTDE